jgi:large subunit ribosomal protein L23
MAVKEKKNIKEETKKTNFVQKYVLKRPHVSEKATDLAEKGFYVFRVEKGANKTEIKAEVQKKYKVNVVGVSVITIPSKKRRVGKTVGKRSGYKKAVVKIKKGQSIDLTLA